MIKNKTIFLKDLGKQDYKKVWEYQKEKFIEIINLKIINRNKSEINKKNIPNYLFIVEHNHVYTLGKNGKYENLLLSENLLKKINSFFYKVDRGGDITYHGPGQIVVYPILDLDNFFTDMNKYLRYLEEVIIRTLSFYGLKGMRSIGETGVWLDVGKLQARKISSIGIRASRWVTMHGFALNVNTNLHYFKYIIPCGIKNKSVTSISNELGYRISMNDVKIHLKKEFQHIFEVIFFELS